MSSFIVHTNFRKETTLGEIYRQTTTRCCDDCEKFVDQFLIALQLFEKAKRNDHSLQNIVNKIDYSEISLKEFVDGCLISGVARHKIYEYVTQPDQNALNLDFRDYFKRMGIEIIQAISDSSISI